MRALLQNCRLIPELSGGCTMGLTDILIEDGTISRVAAKGTLPREENTVDCQGKTLMPGLFDMHMHINWAYHNGEIRLDDFKIFVESCRSARLYLDNGVTTERDLGSARRVAAAVRSAIQADVCVGPRILCSGYILDPVARAVPPDPYNFLREFSGCDELVRAVREEVGGGADVIKLYAPGEPCHLLPEELRAAVRIASIHHKPVAVHAHDLSAIRMCLDEGAHTIEHGSYIDAECIERLKEEKSYLVPTLAVLSHEIATPGYTPEMKKQVLRPLLEANEKNIGAAYRAGLKLGFGTDTPIEELDRLPGMEFRMRKEHCGMENVDLLLQATKYSAEIAGLAGVTGEIREGLCADMILVDGNPDEDISAMYQRPLRVWARGVPYQPRKK